MTTRIGHHSVPSFQEIEAMQAEIKLLIENRKEKRENRAILNQVRIEPFIYKPFFPRRIHEAPKTINHHPEFYQHVGERFCCHD